MTDPAATPPKITRRVYIIAAAFIGGLVLIAGGAMTAMGLITLGQFAVRLIIILGVCALTIWIYARLIRLLTTARPERLPYVHAGLGLTSVAATHLAFTVLFHGTGFTSGTGYLWILPGAAGLTLAMGGWARRVGESRHCPKCEYEFNFNEADAPLRCPECSTPWLGMLKKGRKFKSPRLVAFGIALAVFGMIILQPVFYVGPLAKFLPTPILYTALYVEPKGLYTAWEELATRPLAKRWIVPMAERLLKHRTRQQWDTSGSIWFEAMDKSGRMPPELVDRFYSEGFRAALNVPTRVRAGIPFTAKLRVTRAVEGFGTKLGVMFGGYFIDDGAAAGRAPEATWGYQLRPGVFSRHRDLFEQRLTISEPGTHRIKAVYWVVYQPSFWAMTWQNDGTPINPAAATWFERIDLESTIEVK